jgi:alcohol dehydrogenase (cytochrome c)
VRIPAKDSDIAGALVSMANQGASNWPPPTFSPQTGLFYVPTSESWAMYYKTETDPRGAMGLGGKDEIALSGGENYLKAIDPTTGKVVWRVHYPSGSSTVTSGAGLLTTAGGLLFGSDISGNLVARDASNGKPLWNVHLGTVSNAPETYMLDGSQYVLIGGGDTLYAFRLNP